MNTCMLVGSGMLPYVVLETTYPSSVQIPVCYLYWYVIPVCYINSNMIYIFTIRKRYYYDTEYDNERT
jgi:hypothetical protein